jgi:uncharacterized protein
MIIKYTNYADGIHFIELSKTAAKLGLEEPFRGEVLLNCKMDKSHSQIVLDCDITADSQFTCDRCAVEFRRELTNHFQNIYLFGKREDSEENPDLYFLSPDSDKIDLNFDVAEYAKLSIPMKILCKDECKGLCPVCGVNLNDKSCNCENKVEDPRWAPLKKLKDDLNNKL